MNIINSFSKSGFWNYKNIIIPAACAAPLAIEGAILTKNIYQNPSDPKEKLIRLKNRLHRAFTSQEGETRNQAITRILKNILFSASCLGLMAAAIYGSVALLPSSLAISVAVGMVYQIGKLFLNAEQYKKQIIEAFTTKAGEDLEAARKRIRNNLIKTLVIGTIGITAIALSSYFLVPLLSHFSWSIALPFQTKGVVFMEYASIGAVHGALAYSKYRKGDKGAALFHVFCAALSIFFPFMYWNHQMRLHHSFYGLAALALPYRAMKIFGGLVCFDSALYFIEPVRGFINNAGSLSQYDFINSVVDNFPLFVATHTGAMMAQDVNHSWTKTEPAENPILESRAAYP